MLGCDNLCVAVDSIVCGSNNFARLGHTTIRGASTEIWPQCGLDAQDLHCESVGVGQLCKSRGSTPHFGLMMLPQRRLRLTGSGQGLSSSSASCPFTSGQTSQTRSRKTHQTRGSKDVHFMASICSGSRLLVVDAKCATSCVVAGNRINPVV